MHLSPVHRDASGFTENSCVRCDGRSGRRRPDSRAALKLEAHHQRRQPHSFSLFPLMLGILDRVVCLLPALIDTNTRRARRRARRRLHGTGRQRLRTSPRTDDYENITEVNLRVWHGFVCAAARKMRPTDASAATPSADAQAVRQRLGKDKRKDKQLLPKHTWHCDGCGEENSSRRWSCSCGAKPPESGASSVERRRVQATLPMRRPMSRSMRIRARTPSFDSSSFVPATRAWPPCWRRRSRSATSLFTSLYAWPRKPGRRPAKLWKVPSGKRRTSWSF